MRKQSNNSNAPRETPVRRAGGGKEPSFLFALKAVKQTVSSYLGLLVLVVGIPGLIIKLATAWGVPVSIAAPGALIPAVLICLWLWPTWRAKRNKRLAAEWGVRGQIKNPDYFRLTPYEPGGDFHRADRVHESIYAWLLTSSAPLLYLSGVSGSGKSSIIYGWVLPKFAHDRVPIHAVSARVIGDAKTAVVQALLKPGAIWEKPRLGESEELIDLLGRCAKRVAPKKLLIVLDQFEEFLISDSELQRASFARLLRSLTDNPISGLQVLLIFRADYRALLESLDLPHYEKDTKEVPAFYERDAMMFLRNSGLEVNEEREQEIRQEAIEVEHTPGLIRPITINLFGLVLRQFEVLPKNYRRGTLLRSYLRGLVNQKEVREYAPDILRCMLTGNGTRVSVTCSDVATKIGLSAAEVRGYLVQFANNGIVRELDRNQGKWEIAHDFIAGLLNEILAGWQVSVWARVRPWIIAVGFAVWLVGAVTMPSAYRAMTDSKHQQELLDLHFTPEPCDRSIGLDRREKCLIWTATSRLKQEDLAKAIPHLNNMSSTFGLVLQISFKDLAALGGLINIRKLSISDTVPVQDIDFVTHLKRLTEFSFTSDLGNINGLENLRSVKTLDLSAAHIKNIDVLGSLSALERLKLAYNMDIFNIDALASIVSLQYLDLQSVPTKNVDALKGLINMEELSLASCRELENVDGISTLSHLKKLDLSNTRLTDLKGLAKLSGLEQLRLAGNEVIQDVDALKGLTGLETLDLSGTNIKNINGIKNFARLKTLKFNGKAITNFDELADVLGSLASLEYVDFSINDKTANHEVVSRLQKTLAQLKNLKDGRIRDSEGRPFAGNPPSGKY